MKAKSGIPGAAALALLLAGPGCKADAGGVSDGGAGGVDAEPIDWGNGLVIVTIDPPIALYPPGLTVTPVAAAYDDMGAEVEGASFTWTAEPAGAVEQDGDGWALQAEGPVTFTACTEAVMTDEGNPICGDNTIIVDAGPPLLEITSPQPGDELGPDDQPFIEVRGAATDTHGDPAVFVNGVEAAIDANGNFHAPVDTRFGVNHIFVAASDGLGMAQSTAEFDVLWGESWLPLAGGDQVGVAFGQALALDLGQGFFDDGEPIVIDEEEPVVTTVDLAGVVELILEEIEVLPQIPDPIIEEDEIFLRVPGFDIGSPWVDVDVTDEGVDLFLHVHDARVSTAGYVAVAGETIDLSGGAFASLGTYARLVIHKEGPDEPLVAAVAEVHIAVEDIRGDFVLEAANAVLEVPESVLRNQLEAAILDAISGFLEEIPALVAEALTSIEGALLEQTFELSMEPLPPITLTFGGTLTTVDTELGTTLSAVLDGRFATDAAPVHGDSRGVALPVAAPSIPEVVPATRVQIGIDLAMVNGLMHSLWNSGLLEIDATEFLPAAATALFDEIEIVGRLPPVLGLAADPSTGYPLDMAIGQLEMILRKGAQTDVVGVNLRAGVDLGIIDQAFSLDVAEEPTLLVWLISSDGEETILDSAILEDLIATVVWGELMSALDEGIQLPLPEIALGDMATMAPRLDDFAMTIVQERPTDIRNGFLVIEGRMEGSADLSVEEAEE